MSKQSFIDRAKQSGGVLPTLFNLREMWESNSTRCGGKFNLLFFWAYPIAVVMLLPFTILCLVEMAFTKSAPSAEGSEG